MRTQTEILKEINLELEADFADWKRIRELEKELDEVKGL